jgi:hypothetical protein
MSSPKFIWCSELKVYNDMAFKNGTREYTEAFISCCECKAYMENRPCTNRGRCIIARDSETWEQVSKKTWQNK